MKVLAVVLSGAALLVAACAPVSSPTPSPSAASTEFDLEVVPIQSVGRTIGGARSVFLVTVSGSPEDPPAQISAEASSASISVEPRELPPGMVGEVTVVPMPVSTVGELVVTITASRGGIQRREQRTLEMEPGDDDLAAEAGAHLAPFLDWLALERPELGIGPATAWEATPGAHVLVVSHYLYFSEEWELGLEWHVMIPPSDWTRIYLRHRWTETRPSLAFEVASFAAGDEPREIAPPESVWR